MTKAAVKEMFERAQRRVQEELNDPKGSPFEGSILKLLHQLKLNSNITYQELEDYLIEEIYEMYFPSNLKYYEVIPLLLINEKYVCKLDGNILRLTEKGQAEYTRLKSKIYYIKIDF